MRLRDGKIQRLRKRKKERETKKEKVLGGRHTERESPKILQHRLRQRSQSPQPTDYLGRGDVLAPLNKTHCVHLKYSATQWRTPVMETIGLNNLEQYFTIIYTMSFPSHRHCSFIIVQNPKPRPLLCYREFCWFPFKLWLVPNV